MHADFQNITELEKDRQSHFSFVVDDLSEDRWNLQVWEDWMQFTVSHSFYA